MRRRAAAAWRNRQGMRPFLANEGCSVIVIGYSLGCVGDLMLLSESIEARWSAAVFITLHIGRRPSKLVQLLHARSPMAVQAAEEGMPIVAGNVYVAPPDHHLFVCATDMRLSRGPRINWSRPSIDPMFRSAAEAHGPAVIGIIMSGLQKDGAEGLLEVQRCGGQTIVQDPSDAEPGELPINTLRAVHADHVVALHAMPYAIARCVARADRDCGAIHGSRL
jgi:two-component system chemotaxis response regulator CheB